MESPLTTKALYILSVWPEPTSSAAGSRAAQFISALKDAGFDLTVSSPCRDNHFREQLDVRTVSFKPNDPSFDEFVRELQPELVLFDRFMLEEQFSWRVRRVCPDARLVLDTVDLHGLRRGRQRKAREEPLAVISELGQTELFNDDTIRECASIYRCDLALVTSDSERELLVKRLGLPAALVEVIPLAWPVPCITSSNFSDRRDFVFIGNFNHEPNRDAVKLLKHVLWPEIHRRVGEEAELHIYGAYVGGEFQQMDNKVEGFRVCGHAADALQTLSQYRVNLVPLRFGAGQKGKIGDGWCAGTPCVTTSVGIEGMGPWPEVSDEWGEFSACASHLYQDQSLWELRQCEGFQRLSAGFNQERILGRFVGILRYVVERERRADIVREMLWYNGNRSTEFFSRWIEEKSRR